MKANIEIELKPFTVPNFAVMTGDQVGENEQRSFPLCVLDPLTLDRMCREFRDAVFEKAGKQQPPTCAPVCISCGSEALK